MDFLWKSSKNIFTDYLGDSTRGSPSGFLRYSSLNSFGKSSFDFSKIFPWICSDISPRILSRFFCRNLTRDWVSVKKLALYRIPFPRYEFEKHQNATPDNRVQTVNWKKSQWLALSMQTSFRQFVYSSNEKLLSEKLFRHDFFLS